MNSFRKYAPMSFPVLLGLGLALLGTKIIRSEKILQKRKLELEIKLHKSKL
tara:strand:- start:20 stop:172 length:153 start_codon:yes stop_codon:yes gene_type:complete